MCVYMLCESGVVGVCGGVDWCESVSVPECRHKYLCVSGLECVIN